MSKQDRKKVPIPMRMRHLDVDKRGYPIPVMVQRDKHGIPMLAVNDEAKRQIVIAKDLCSICGKPLFKRRWFIGGPRSAFETGGCYIDPPVHEDCGRYAMQVCPYLRHDLRGHNPNTEAIAERLGISTSLVTDPTAIPGVPATFVMLWVEGQTYSRERGFVSYMAPRRPYVAAEFWANTYRIPDEQGLALINALYPGMLKPEIFKGYAMEEMVRKVLEDATRHSNEMAQG